MATNLGNPPNGDPKFWVSLKRGPGLRGV